jgi:small-conductance mechanosensitive channel
MEGRVERVGWYQTRLRGRDTRPTYVPNNVFVQHLVTNMDRISEPLTAAIIIGVALCIWCSTVQHTSRNAIAV